MDRFQHSFPDSRKTKSRLPRPRLVEAFQGFDGELIKVAVFSSGRAIGEPYFGRVYCGDTPRGNPVWGDRCWHAGVGRVFENRSDLGPVFLDSEYRGNPVYVFPGDPAFDAAAAAFALDGAPEDLIAGLIRGAIGELYAETDQPGSRVLILADALAEAGRSEEEALLRENRRIKVVKGKVVAL